MIEYQQQQSIAHITLARPQVLNALSGDMMRQLAAVLREVSASPARVICLRGSGKHFCGGADLEWMRQCAAGGAAVNQREAQVLADLLYQLHTLPQPTVAVIHGACYGGGGGLAAAADICIAADSARFCFSEVKLGLIPATISPYVIAAIGERAARRYFLDGSVFSAATAQQLGLVHTLVAVAELDGAVDAQLAQLLQGGAEAQRLIKTLLLRSRGRALEPALLADTAAWLAECRAGAEAQEGVAAFLDKREPNWRVKS